MFPQAKPFPSKPKFLQHTYRSSVFLPSPAQATELRRIQGVCRTIHNLLITKGSYKKEDSSEEIYKQALSIILDHTSDEMFGYIKTIHPGWVISEIYRFVSQYETHRQLKQAPPAFLNHNAQFELFMLDPLLCFVDETSFILPGGAERFNLRAPKMKSSDPAVAYKLYASRNSFVFSSLHERVVTRVHDHQDKYITQLGLSILNEDSCLQEEERVLTEEGYELPGYRARYHQRARILNRLLILRDRKSDHLHDLRVKQNHKELIAA